MMMQQKVWNFGQFSELDQQFQGQQYERHDVISAGKFDLFSNSSPPPPYSKEDLLNFQSNTHNITTCPRRSSLDENDKKGMQCDVSTKKETRQQYDDVGEEITVTISISPNVEIGLSLLFGDSFTPSWPTILDIKEGYAAYNAIPRLQIGDQIKELNNTPTEGLSNVQVTALFSEATDCVTMTLRRGVEPTKRDFEWFQYPFLSVKKSVEEIVIFSPKASVHSSDQDSRNSEVDPQFHTFKDPTQNHQQLNRTKEKRFRCIEVVNNTNCNKLSRTLSSPCASSRRDYLKMERPRRNTADDINNRQNMLLNGYFHRYDLAYNKNNHQIFYNDKKEGKYIADEIEKLSLNDSNQDLQSAESRIDASSESSLNSAFSSSTISSMSSSMSTIEQISNTPQNYLTNNHIYQQQSDNKSTENMPSSSPATIIPTTGTTNQLNYFIKTPVNKLRDSFRRRMKNNRNNTPEVNNIPNGQNHHLENEIHPAGNTLTITVWIPDRKKLGVRFGGGSVSLYGDSNICVMDIKKEGTAAKCLRVGDEVLQIDGISIHGMDVFQVNRLISKLDGNYVEFKIFRPSV